MSDTPPTPLTIRRATLADSRACFDVFRASVTDLAERLCSPWNPDVVSLWERMQPVYEHLGEQAAEWWVAENGAEGLIGYARSIERGGLFELSEFFVHPGSQSAGLGGRLLERAFPPGRGDVRVIIATTDVRAQRRYYQSGAVARFPIAALARPPRPDDAEEADGGDLEPVRAMPDDIEALLAVERAVIEFDRGAHEMAWLLGQREGYLYRRAGRAVGIGFIGRVGSGPVAALDPADQPAILRHLAGRALALGRENLSFEVPMVNQQAMNHLLARGFQLDTFFTLLMSSRPFGQFDRFIGFAPPFVL